MSGSPLAGARIALTGARKAEETADFVRRQGGVPIVAPSLATTSFDSPADAPSSGPIVASDTELHDPAADLDRILSEDLALAVFLTGVGARALFRLADSRGKQEQLRTTLDRATVVARGPKALGALKGAGVRVDWLPKEATVEAVVAGLDRVAVADRAALIQLSGFADNRIATALTRRGARVIELDLYRHLAPADEAPVLALFDLIRDGGVDFLTFTSAIAVRGFFAVAERHGRDDEIIAALRNGPVVPVSVGPVTGAALTEVGAPTGLIPDTHTTGGMLRAIGLWIAAHPAQR